MRKAARLTAQLPPGSAIFRPDDVDSRLWSVEAHLLATLVDMWAENPMDRPSDLAKKQAAREKRDAIAAYHAQRQGLMGRADG